jgi:hypothetical protein
LNPVIGIALAGAERDESTMGKDLIDEAEPIPCLSKVGKSRIEPLYINIECSLNNIIQRPTNFVRILHGAKHNTAVLVIKNLAGILLSFLERSADEEDIDTLSGSESERAGLCAPSYSAIKERIPCVRLAGVAIPKDAYKSRSAMR